MNQGEVCDDIDHGSIMVEVYSQCSLGDHEVFIVWLVVSWNVLE